MPHASCTLYAPNGKNMPVWADDIGIVHLWGLQAAASETYFLDCSEAGAVSHYDIDLAEASAFQPAVPRATRAPRITLPALTDYMGPTQEELIKAGY
ncbi:MAG TPA: hypothetical protein VF395_02220, partial [Polyangiaceae bacterium]